MNTLETIAKKLNLSIERIYELRQYTGAPTDFRLKAWREFVGTLQQEQNKLAHEQSEDESNGLPNENPYDTAIEQGLIIYEDAYLRERVNGQLISNSKKQIELETARGELITLEEFDAMMLKQQTAFLSALECLPDYATETAKASEKPALQKLCKKWILQIRQKAADTLGE